MSIHTSLTQKMAVDHTCSMVLPKNPKIQKILQARLIIMTIGEMGQGPLFPQNFIPLCPKHI